METGHDNQSTHVSSSNRGGDQDSHFSILTQCFHGWSDVSSSTHAPEDHHQLSTSTTTTPRPLQVPLPYLEEEEEVDDQDSEDNLDCSTDEGYSKCYSSGTTFLLKRKLVNQIKAAANKIIELLEEFIEALRMLIGVKALRFSESRLDPENL
jgi:hypothetical protein